ncbi:hypothetical protein L6452_31021 [Arctium lappa]|uniref:Uncharacterized protein n=1 Tax=Arctium lappa TaxID=4217 RepID=A0ACB8ZJW8_ARCLA|nr:hypothetical protein L6452_31021 [Arctium lappa]
MASRVTIHRLGFSVHRGSKTSCGEEPPARADVTDDVTLSMHAHQPSSMQTSRGKGVEPSSQGQGNRTSAFQRLSFASAVGQSSNGMLDFYPLDDRKSNVVAILIELAKECSGSAKIDGRLHDINV